MQKIDKTNILSKEYKEWLESLEENNHPKYSSSSHKHYDDIKMSLLYCQNGLCAYTEQLLCDPKYISIENWDSEKYSTKLSTDEKNSIQVDLEHFDESLKPNNGWLWNNFFVVATHNNCRIKGSKPIDNILKPDREDYDPYKYLEFDFETGMFIANISLTDEEKKRVNYMIQTLGMNCIHSQRKKYLKLLLDRKEIGLEVEPYEYITAWNMTIKNLDKE
jgi:hypothetical protein